MVVGTYRLAMSQINASCRSLHAVHSSALDVPCIQMAGNVCVHLESASEFQCCTQCKCTRALDVGSCSEASCLMRNSAMDDSIGGS